MSSSNFKKSNNLIQSFVIAGLGTLSSLWTNCIFVICLQNDLYTSNDHREFNRKYYNLIFQTIQYEYVAICLIAVVTLIWGLTKLNRKYIIPWTCLKICENIAIFIGTILILFEFDGFNGLIPLGIAAICINVYALLYVYKVYKRILIKLPLKNLKNNSQVLEETSEEDVKIKFEELHPLSTEIVNSNLPFEKCEKNTI